MITHLIKIINWVDVAFVIVLVRMIFIGVKNGFISEFLKSISIIFAVFVSFHFYSFLASWMALKTHYTWAYWELLMFADLWCAVMIFFKYFREGVLMLFKVETNHEGFDTYAGGFLALVRGILVTSLTIFLLLLVHYGPLTRMTLNSYSFKIAGRTAVSTYSYIYKNFVDKLFVGEHYNGNPAQELSAMGRK